MNIARRTRLKIFTSFALAALSALTFARLALEHPFPMNSISALAVAGILCAAGLWRGVMYLRFMRSSSGL